MSSAQPSGRPPGAMKNRAFLKRIETTKPLAGRAVDLLVAAGVLVETTGKKRDRCFVYRAYLDHLTAGTELESAPRARLSRR